MQTYRRLRTANMPHVRNRGFTLIELTVAISLMAVIVIAVCGIYFYILRLWERSQTATLAYMTAVAGMSRIEERAEKASYGYVTTGINPYQLVLYYPSNKNASGQYVPQWTYRQSSGKFILDYYSQTSIYSEVFYLSDASGDRTARGNILWRGKLMPSVGWVPDRDWSLIPGTNEGRVAPIQSIAFAFLPSLPYTTVPNVLTMTVTASRDYGGRTNTVRIKKSIMLRNHE